MATLLERFRRDPLQAMLLLFVLTLHLFFILLVLFSPEFTKRKKEHKHLIVKTISPRPVAKTPTIEKKAAAPVAAAKSQPPAPAKKQTLSAEKPVPTKKETTPKSSPAAKKEPAVANKVVSKSKTPPAKKAAPPQERAKISDSLLAELEESIAKIDAKPSPKKSSPANKAVAPLVLQIDIPVEFADESQENSYTDQLVHHLHQALSLPEYGEVKMQLSLRQDGSVAKLTVLKAQSEKNKRYLESHLPHLKFPRFDGPYANKKEYTFILTFCNE